MQCIKTKAEKKLTKEQREEALQQMLDEDYPVALAVSLSSLKIVLVIATVVLQVLSFIYKSKYYYVASAFWVAPFVLIAELLVIAVVRRRTVRLFNLSNLARLISNLIEVGLIAPNIQALRKTPKDSPEYQYIWINIAILACGVVIKLSTLVITIVMRLKTNKAFKLKAEAVSEQSDKKLMS